MGQAPPGNECNKRGDGVPFVKAGEFGDPRPVIREWTTKPLKHACEGDVLICVVGATCGKINLGAECAIGRSVAAIRPTTALDQAYLFAFLKTLVTKLRAESVGSAQGVISRDDIGRIEIPLPPAAEQRRIVAKIDRLSARSKRARDELEVAERLVQRLKSSIVASEFLRCQTKDGFDRSLSELALSTFYGPRIAGEAYVATGVPTLRTTDIADWGRLDLRDPPRVQVGPGEMSKWQLLDGDLIITRTGATIGKCAVYNEAMGPALPSAYLIRARLNKALLHPYFAILFLLSPDGQRQLLAGRTATAQPNINASAILALRLPVPSLQRQAHIVRRIEHAFAAIDRLAAAAQSARALLDKLDQAILAKAFRGELVPQDPNDEPASVLLERIRAERAATPTPRRRGARAAT